MRSTIVLAVLAASLVACMSRTIIHTTGAAELLSACSGSYSCTQDASSSVVTTVLTKADDGTCRAGELTLTNTEDADAGGTRNVIAEDGSTVATWSGDPTSFQICSSDGCLACTAKADGGSSSSSSGGGKCTGSTSCSGSDCSYTGCSVDAHPHYGIDGTVDYYDNECYGTTRDCSSWDTKSECSDEGCTWKE